MKDIQLFSHAVDFTSQTPVIAYAPAGRKSGATCNTIEIADRNAIIYEGGCDDNCKLSQAITGHPTPARGLGEIGIPQRSWGVAVNRHSEAFDIIKEYANVKKFSIVAVGRLGQTKAEGIALLS